MRVRAAYQAAGDMEVARRIWGDVDPGESGAALLRAGRRALAAFVAAAGALGVGLARFAVLLLRAAGAGRLEVDGIAPAAAQDVLATRVAAGRTVGAGNLDARPVGRAGHGDAGGAGAAGIFAPGGGAAPSHAGQGGGPGGGGGGAGFGPPPAGG